MSHNCLIICPKCKRIAKGIECQTYGTQLIQDLKGNQECLRCWIEDQQNDYKIHSYDLRSSQ